LAQPRAIAFKPVQDRAPPDIKNARAIHPGAKPYPSGAAFCHLFLENSMRTPASLLVAGACLCALACDSPVQPVRPANTVRLSASAVNASRGESEESLRLSAEGEGHYLLSGTTDVKFEFEAHTTGNGGAEGEFRQRTTLDNGTVDITGDVTCLAVDAVNHRAWIGGVVRQNRSTSPDYQDPTTARGQDVWFRVLEGGDDAVNPGRSTFLGFVGSIPSSASYCQQQIWAPDNARTWPVTEGKIDVRP
jgi:hypothetical protein